MPNPNNKPPESFNLCTATAMSDGLVPSALNLQAGLQSLLARTLPPGIPSLVDLGFRVIGVQGLGFGV